MILGFNKTKNLRQNVAYIFYGVGNASVVVYLSLFYRSITNVSVIDNTAVQWSTQNSAI